ncbi:hypothetical protein A2331_03150 [Candidatus Falkowbacteria bacterium RIFOXYB2_FULL_34_18]|uniref:Uncharacterized protein n=1 Tax=Candidatus Falkowbacteria bacterium RIFOXYD2_FULL_34_120 TaxID=1798007 RepID=A0A1F5TN13_9BACT|nr:MAG: hypothetical protein A2500_00120 [Candidatus Falkowbacteria bacterium RIFOXYC12_FULL_34_55]OGF28629.1 MAG: hypothetical protein A2331_03150 [Candidatus Falkowbacteria bacterium RIFOXYB2_FULL_34_18]OGF38191.1 MAG: hypothetical protein A2466_00045 [Candidatus Falkowbacteria bacterium RIFOXYC2_FULL_34_220]OGF38301.1 MAG: hypothetical protein A2515_00790 [Candidatus Falkowbacteria bacterium RIFOXYD12_FULL_34_57]OGF40276.1 MAG: hypothetical protein A2531_04565 [Candidatus Falkowbacteria bact
MKKCLKCFNVSFKEFSNFDVFCSQCGSKLEIKKNKYKVTLSFVIEIDYENDLIIIKKINNTTKHSHFGRQNYDDDDDWGETWGR